VDMETGKVVPIWAIKALSGPDYRLIWWMLHRCDGEARLHKGWRQRAEEELGWSRVHLWKTIRKLQRQEIISRERYDRAVRLNVKAFSI